MLDEGAPSPRLSASTSSETIWLVPSLTKGSLHGTVCLDWYWGVGGGAVLKVICQRGGALLAVCLSLNALEFDPLYV